MNGSLRFLLRRARRPRAALLALGLTALSLTAACDDADEGQTPVCPADAPPEEACFTAPGSGSGSAGSNSGGSGGSAGEAGAAGEAGQSAAGAGGDGG
jgi:hypothetical protein